ncbi:RagB/SusD family nutrient uptake outer membrane protein [Rapidithrix thailandica]|uniref:RagB/SusD family nutrient uptake outer membrane protein n=1 Tax=Rapidithrix thailandica TaxID=413964 RepID=A0AAW9S9W7_9BACT
MKTLIYIIVLSVFAGILGACNNEFMERYPTTAVTPENFFSTPADLETYSNGFYGQLSLKYNDLGSDNISHYNSGTTTIERVMRGEIDPTTVGDWNWGDLRNINFMLENARKVSGEAGEINHYMGIARFFRAWFYYEKVKTYGNVPWYPRTIQTDDEDLLYKAQDPREVVVDSILADLDFAVEHIRSDQHNTQVSKWAALSLLARVALQEGTYRKYHTELGLDDATSFLQKAATAAQTIMEEGGYSLDPDYGSLFRSVNLSGSRETILFVDYDKDLDKRHNSQTVFDYEYALSRSLVDTYLKKSDGKPFTSVPDNEEATLHEIFNDRDPRLMNTVMQPGFTIPGSSNPYRMKPFLGGYIQIKFFPPGEDHIGWDLTYTDLPVFRYAETLLIYAEAKAELGTLTQEDLDKSVNLLRQRVEMPAMDLATVQSEMDPVLEQRYFNVTGPQKGAILEIRRERRVELACEGFRLGDLMRWKLGKLLEKEPEGMYVEGLGAMDVTGDGVDDIAILESSDKTGPIDGLPNKDDLSLYFLKDDSGKLTSFYLEFGDHGHIRFTRNLDLSKKFIEPKYYYLPISETQMLLNPNLEQSIGW